MSQAGSYQNEGRLMNKKERKKDMFVNIASMSKAWKVLLNEMIMYRPKVKRALR
jgi:hypothetical protein